MSDSSTHEQPRKLLTFSSGGWVILLSLFFTVGAALLVGWPIIATRGARAVGDGQRIDTYGFDLSNLTVNRNVLVASGFAKDGIRALTPDLVDTITPAEAELINKNERGNFLIDPDRVIGVNIGGESRAYPLRVLNHHEIVNDVVGGVPVAITYHPLCDSAVVFDRRDKNGQVRVFGVSGLLYNSNLVMYDRQNDQKDESLWVQLLFKPVAGPAVTRGEVLERLPFRMARWSDWRVENPGTTVLRGQRVLKKEYRRDPYVPYFANDDLKFAVSPLWSDKRFDRKARIVAVPQADGTWQVHDAQKLSRPDALFDPATPQVHACIFAWHAMHAGHYKFAN